MPTMSIDIIQPCIIIIIIIIIVVVVITIELKLVSKLSTTKRIQIFLSKI